MLTAQKHLIKCKCILPQFRKQKNPPNHQFTVMSILEDDVVKQKFVQCTNCGIIHKVIDICKSEIMNGVENTSLISIDDIKMSISEKYSKILEANFADLPTWEMVQFILENEQWGNYVIIQSEKIDDQKQGKLLRILGENLCKIEPFTTGDVIK